MAPQLRVGQIDHLGNSLAGIAAGIDFQVLSRALDETAARDLSTKGGRPPYPTGTRVRMLVLKRLNSLSDERMEFLLRDRLSYQRFRGLTQALNVPDRTTIWTFENRMGEAGARVLFNGVTEQLLRKGFIARGDQMMDATWVPTPKQKISQQERAITDQDATPADGKPAQRRQKDTDATWTKTHGKSDFGDKLSVNVDKPHKFIRTIVTDTASTGDSCHFDNVFYPSTTSRDVYADRGYPPQRAGGTAQESQLSIPDPAERAEEQAVVRLPAARASQNLEIPAGRACVRWHRTNGRQVRPDDRTGASEFRDDDDGGLLQHEAAGLLPPSGRSGLLASKIRLIA